jgi:hypothetical protein
MPLWLDVSLAVVSVVIVTGVVAYVLDRLNHTTDSR